MSEIQLSDWWMWLRGERGEKFPDSLVDDAVCESVGAIPSPRGQEAEQTVCGVAGVAHNHGRFSGEAGDVCDLQGREWGTFQVILPDVFTIRCRLTPAPI